MKVVFSSKARDDLARIGDHIAKDNPRRALNFVRALRDRAQELGNSPYAFPLVRRYEDIGIRRRVYGNYLILCRTDPSSVSIVRIFHGARDIERLLNVR